MNTENRRWMENLLDKMVREGLIEKVLFKLSPENYLSSDK